jgi:quinol monooxygenase YgiN
MLWTRSDPAKSRSEQAMVHVLIRHKVADFNSWKAVFDGAFMFRKNAGECSFHLFRDNSDPSDLTLVFEWESSEMAQRFLGSEQLKREMAHAGVLGEPEMRILHEMVTMRRTAAD